MCPLSPLPAPPCPSAWFKVVTRGSDQLTVSTQHSKRHDRAVIANFGKLLLDIARCVPDGIAAFFPSYGYMEHVLSEWNRHDVLGALLATTKLIFVETPCPAETAQALANYRLVRRFRHVSASLPCLGPLCLLSGQLPWSFSDMLPGTFFFPRSTQACDNGRGAILLAVARGKVSEGIDLDNHYGRAVIVFGVPFLHTESPVTKERLAFLRQERQISEREFLTFDAVRQAAQCVGRAIRGKTDYGLMIFADYVRLWMLLCPLRALSSLCALLADMSRASRDPPCALNCPSPDRILPFPLIAIR